jgi:putative endonuclease
VNPRFSLLRAKHLRLGGHGENVACKLLRSKHYRILARNYKCKAGEIDIVARDGAVLVFVEVKTRYYTTVARPAEGLTLKQKKRIVRASRRYLRQIEKPAVVCRFDLVELRMGRFLPRELRHWQNHFSAAIVAGGKA